MRLLLLFQISVADLIVLPNSGALLIDQSIDVIYRFLYIQDCCVPNSGFLLIKAVI